MQVRPLPGDSMQPIVVCKKSFYRYADFLAILAPLCSACRLVAHSVQTAQKSEGRPFWVNGLTLSVKWVNPFDFEGRTGTQ